VLYAGPGHKNKKTTPRGEKGPRRLGAANTGGGAWLQELRLNGEKEREY